MYTRRRRKNTLFSSSILSSRRVWNPQSRILRFEIGIVTNTKHDETQDGRKAVHTSYYYYYYYITIDFPSRRTRNNKRKSYRKIHRITTDFPTTTHYIILCCRECFVSFRVHVYIPDKIYYFREISDRLFSSSSSYQRRVLALKLFKDIIIQVVLLRGTRLITVRIKIASRSAEFLIRVLYIVMGGLHGVIYWELFDKPKTSKSII